MKRLFRCATCGAALAAGLLLAGCGAERTRAEAPFDPRHDVWLGPKEPARRGGWPTRQSNENWHCVAMALPTGDPGTSAIGVEKCVPHEARANAAFDSEIVITNLTTHPLHDVEVTDQLRGGLRYEKSEPQGRIDGDVIRWSLGELAAGESRIIRVAATAPSAGTAGNCVSVTYTALLCAEVTITQPKLVMVKSGPSQPLVRCDEIPFQYEVRNDGTGVIQGVKIEDPLPEGMRTIDGLQTITFEVGDLPAGASMKYTATVKADRTGRFENKATAGSASGLRAESRAVVTVVREPILRISKTGPEREFLGRGATYEITVRNVGDGEARNTVISDPISSGARFVTASDGGRVQQGAVTWDIGTLQPNQSRTVTVEYARDTPGTLRNSATATAYCAESVSSEPVETQYTGISAILLEVIDMVDPVQVGKPTTYVIVITNQGTAPDNNIRLICQLEKQRFLQAFGPTRGVHQDGTVTFDPLPALGPGQKAEYRVSVEAADVGDIRFRATLQSALLQREVMETESTNQYR